MNRSSSRAVGAAGVFFVTLHLLWVAHGIANEPESDVVPEWFQDVHQLLEDHVQREQICGAVGLVIDHGKIVYSDAVGFRDGDSKTSMTRDSLFRIASMTKPITSTAILMLEESGQLKLSDPISRFIPEFREMTVLVTNDDGSTGEVPANRELTVRDLLTHTSGITYGFFGGQHQTLYRKAGITNGLIDSRLSLADNSQRLAQVALANQPGENWQYGLSTDVLGRVVEVVSGQDLNTFFQERIFKPLKMVDTHFSLPRKDWPRLAALYRPRSEGGIERVGDGARLAGELRYSATYPLQQGDFYFSGGAGLVSTAADYARFLQMLARNGELNGVRLLKPETIEAMTTNQIGDLNILFQVHGDKFGYGVGIHSRDSELVTGADGVSIGSYSWGGIFHTYFWVDPKRDVIGILMTQLFPFDHLTLWHDYTRRVCAALNTTSAAGRATGPQPGEVYREYSIHNGGNRDWRVTDPQARSEGAWKHLPNSLLTIHVDDLQGAIRAEALIDRWGGHTGTANKRIRFNHHPWLTLPELETTADDRPEYYYSQDNPIIEVPLDHLKQGINTLDGTCGEPGGVNWGQWGLYSLILRVYYDPDARPHAGGRIVQPVPETTFGENPTIRLDVSPSVARADLLAWYDGYDENGDGIYRDWHGSRHQAIRGEPAELRNHVGTVNRHPFELTWNTRWVPDQPPGSIKIIARIQDHDGVWSVTSPVEGLTLRRTQESVVLYKPEDIPERFGVRVGRKKSCTISLPEDEPVSSAMEAVLALRTWHGWDGHHEPLHFNEHRFPIDGLNHHYDFDMLPLPTKELLAGPNRFTIESGTEHHMLEVLWPGPALLVRYRQP